MQLTDYEKRMQNGEMGEPYRKAMDILVALGESFDAERMVEVKNTHLAGASIIVTGEAGIKFAENIQSQGGCFCTRTTSNPTALDSARWRELGMDEKDAEMQGRLTNALAKLGTQVISTCIPYFVGNAPRFGEHVAWGESSAVIYANSVLGARTNREGGPSGLAAALCGRVPEFGFHLKENRYGKLLINVTTPLSGVTDYGCLGYYAGTLSSQDTPVFTGIPAAATPDELKALSAALGSSGAVTMFHAVGVTPEAPDLETAFGGGRPELVVEFGEKEKQMIVNKLDREKSDDIGWVMMGCPHASIFEFADIARAIGDKKVNPDVTLWVCTSAQIKTIADRMGYTAIIEKAGGKVVCDTCPVLAPTRDLAQKMGHRILTTNSAKMAHYSPGQFGLMTHYGNIDKIIEAAISGKWKR